MNLEPGRSPLWTDPEETERKLQDAEAELHLMRSRLRRLLAESEGYQLLVGPLLEALPIGLLWVGPEGRLRSLNAAAERMFGVDRHEVRGRPYEELWPHRGSPTGRLLAGRSRESQEIRRLDGSLLSLDSEVFPVTGSGAKGSGAVEMLTDRSEARHLSRELESQRSMAALGRMAAVAAHEIRNPLGGMVGFLDLLERELPETDRRRRHTARIREGMGALERLVSGFMEFSRPVEDVHVPLDLREIATLVSMDLGPMGRRLGVDLEVSLCRRPAPVKGDVDRLRGAVANLARNALEASPEGGKVQLRVLGGRMPLVMVEDEGPGVAPDMRSRMFEPFVSGKARGTGLGLALVARTAEAHRGLLRYQPRQPRGSRFVLALPEAGGRSA